MAHEADVVDTMRGIARWLYEYKGNCETFSKDASDSAIICIFVPHIHMSRRVFDVGILLVLFVEFDGLERLVSIGQVEGAMIRWVRAELLFDLRLVAVCAVERNWLNVLTPFLSAQTTVHARLAQVGQVCTAVCHEPEFRHTALGAGSAARAPDS